VDHPFCPYSSIIRNRLAIGVCTDMKRQALSVKRSDTGGEITGLTRRINYDEKTA